MSDLFISEIFLFSGNFAPRGSSFCMGQLLPVASEQALFSLINATYGGDARSSFGLPELRGRTPIGYGGGSGLTYYNLGASGGVESVQLTASTMPDHSHEVSVEVGPGAPDSEEPNGHYFSNQQPNNRYSTTVHASQFKWADSGSAGGSLPHNNMQPYQVINYCMQIHGTYPSRN